MADGFEIGRAFGGALAGFQPIADGTLDLASFRQMMRQEFRLTRDPLGKAPLHDFGDARMQLLPIAAQKRAVGGILHQSVLEGVNRLWRRSALEHKFRSDEPSQFVLQLPLVSGGDGAEQLVRKLTADGSSGLRYLFGSRPEPIEPRQERRLQCRRQGER
jgi:hypothetical protein